MVATVEPMRHHGPGWILEIDEGNAYWLWAPQDGKIRDPYEHTWASSAPKRPNWAACWQSEDGEDGDYVKVDSAQAALAIFPEDVKRQFLAAIQRNEVR